MISEKSAGLIVFLREGKKIKYLLLHYKVGHWDFSKGHIEKGESPEQAAKRELEEEAGIKKIEIIPGFSCELEYFFRKRKLLVKKKVVFFLAETQKKEIKLSFEHKGYQWLGYEEVLSKLTFKGPKKALEKAHLFCCK